MFGFAFVVWFQDKLQSCEVHADAVADGLQRLPHGLRWHTACSYHAVVFVR